MVSSQIVIEMGTLTLYLPNFAYIMFVAPCHCSGYFKVHAKFFQSPYILYDTLSPPNILICCKNHVLLKHLDTHPGISSGSILVFFLMLPYNVIIHCTFTIYRTLKQRKIKIRPSTKILNPKIIENIVVVSVYRLLASSAILWL